MSQKFADPFFELYHLPDGGNAPQPMPSAERLQVALGKEGSHGLILFAPPQRIAAHALAESGIAERELERWRSEASPVLDAIRLLRGQILIAEAPASEQASTRLHGAISEKFPGKNIPNIDVRLPDAAPVWAAAGWVSVLQSPIVVHMLGEIQARSPIRYEEMPDIGQALQDLLSRHQDELDQLKAETLANDEVTEREQAALDRSKDAVARANILADQIGQLEESLRDSSAKEADLERVNAALAKKSEKLESAKAKLEDRIALYRGSVSWRMTAPIRAGSRLFKRLGGGR
ncbi:hypothetical protein HFP51_01185 [Parasphingopyxis sp. CP4]|uniref:hypothetical protein n=1 Tax=Parasphingopyxis sp. CP4 TaxID=2724527 RepID=UPI0015A4BD24|nr:hypothetical protein [Parasphingopyxis sp. CP4]QLC20918.1 hypothetical protein HFP51_01185 [Parasphingopyxis sp. CP4]